MTRKVHRLPLDEVLHRAGGNQTRIVARGVCGPEGVTINQDFNVRAEHRACVRRLLAVAMKTVNNDIAFAVVISLCAACELAHSRISSRRKRAMRNTCSSASANSS